MDLGKHVVDKDLIDRNDHISGKVDDLILQLLESTDDPEASSTLGPVVKAIVTGPMALSLGQPGFIGWLVRQFYRLLGLADPRPVEIGWEHIKAIDVVVHLDVSREEIGLDGLARAVNSRYIEHLPGA